MFPKSGKRFLEKNMLNQRVLERLQLGVLRTRSSAGAANGIGLSEGAPAFRLTGNMVKLPQKSLCVLLGAAFAIAAGLSARAEELTARLPPYRPKIGEERVYRIEIETSADSHGLTKVGEKSVRGEFANSLTVLESTPTGFKMRWRLSPKEPPPGQPAEGETPPAQVIPLPLFDARKEAEKWW